MLLNKTGEFVAFGYEAEQIYSEARSKANSCYDVDVSDSDIDDDVTKVEEEEYDVEDLLLFKQFKMMLMKNKVQCVFVRTGL